MQVPETLGKIVKRDNVLESECQKRALDRHIGRSNEADGQPESTFGSFVNISGMQ